MGDGYVTLKEAAARLGCDASWLNRLCKEGRVLGARKEGRAGVRDVWKVPADFEMGDVKWKQARKGCGVGRKRG